MGKKSIISLVVIGLISIGSLESISAEGISSNSRIEALKELQKGDKPDVKEITKLVRAHGLAAKENPDVSDEEIKKLEERIKQLEESASKNKASQEVVGTITYALGDVGAVFNKLVKQYGLSQVQSDMWAWIITRESNWSVTATNPSSGAYGIPQSLPGNKMATHGADWQTNPETQLRWMYDYMIGRYGSIEATYQFWQANHWY